MSYWVRVGSGRRRCFHKAHRNLRKSCATGSTGSALLTLRGAHHLGGAGLRFGDHGEDASLDEPARGKAGGESDESGDNGLGEHESELLAKWSRRLQGL